MPEVTTTSGSFRLRAGRIGADEEVDRGGDVGLGVGLLRGRAQPAHHVRVQLALDQGEELRRRARGVLDVGMCCTEAGAFGE